MTRTIFERIVTMMITAGVIIVLAATTTLTSARTTVYATAGMLDSYFPSVEVQVVMKAQHTASIKKHGKSEYIYMIHYITLDRKLPCAKVYLRRGVMYFDNRTQLQYCDNQYRLHTYELYDVAGVRTPTECSENKKPYTLVKWMDSYGAELSSIQNKLASTKVVVNCNSPHSASWKMYNRKLRQIKINK